MKPLKRHPTLVPLSQEHHHTLALCTRILRKPNANHQTDITAHFIDLEKHFLKEETLFAPLGTNCPMPHCANVLNTNTPRYANYFVKPNLMMHNGIKLLQLYCATMRVLKNVNYLKHWQNMRCHPFRLPENIVVHRIHLVHKGTDNAVVFLILNNHNTQTTNHHSIER